MKLLSFSIPLNTQNFRSLSAGFSIKFHTLNNTDAMESFSPFCFAGLNGSGKSNVLEALANIFYHLEFCVARYKPNNFETHFNRKECLVDAYKIEYLIGQHNRKDYALYFFDKVTITKNIGEEPKMVIKKYPFGKTVEEEEISLTPSINKQEAAEGKQYLPAHIVGYSSGENETLSLPFIKCRLVHLDEYKQALKDKYNNYQEPENSLIYIDNNMSQAVLLACLLFENEKCLKPLKTELNIQGLTSFRMHLNLHYFEFKDKKNKTTTTPILELIEQEQIDKLKKCATFWHQNENTLVLDFYINDATKDAFKHHFNNNSFEVFQLFRLLYELNSHFLDEVTIEKVYQSQGLYTDWKVPTGLPEQDVFHFLDFYVSKIVKQNGEVKDLLLREFSDGEHQFIHTMGICLLLKDRRTLLLLDEPETHFNPSWRAKFIKILNDSITESTPKDLPNGDYNIHLLKDILLTSHSPFIISDCLPDNVILFERDKKGNVTAKKVSELENSFITYGTSVELILDRLFDYRQSIGDLSNAELKKIDFTNLTKDKVSAEKAKLQNLGESIEKDMVLARLNRIEMQPKNNA